RTPARWTVSTGVGPPRRQHCEQHHREFVAAAERWDARNDGVSLRAWFPDKNRRQRLRRVLARRAEPPSALTTRRRRGRLKATLSRSEAEDCALASLGRLVLTIARRRTRRQRVDQAACNSRNVVDGAIERRFVRFRRRRESAQLPDELHRRRADFFVGRRRI